MSLVVYFLACFGATQIALYGKILDNFRPDIELFKCSMCTGFWIGIILYYLFGMSGKLDVNFWSFEFLLYGFASSGVSYVMVSLFNDEGLKITRGKQ